MIVTAIVSWRRLAAEGKAYKWNRPSCPNHCACKAWGHGRVLRYFEGFPAGLYVQRFRCPACGAVMTMRPEGFLPRFQTATRAIFEALRCRLGRRRWPPGLPRQRAGHWLRAFLTKVAMHFPGEDPLATLLFLHAAGIDLLV
jgi:hypothetical protein